MTTAALRQPLPTNLAAHRAMKAKEGGLAVGTGRALRPRPPMARTADEERAVAHTTRRERAVSILLQLS